MKAKQITSAESQKILQARGREIMQSYPWGRFKGLANALHERGAINDELAAYELGSTPRGIDIDTQHSELGRCHGLENDYRDILNWFDSPGKISEGGSSFETVILPPMGELEGGFCYHVIWRKGELEGRMPDEKRGPRHARRDSEKIIIYRKIKKETLDVLVNLYEKSSEIEILLPRYWPEEFGNKIVLQKIYRLSLEIEKREEQRCKGFSCPIIYNSDDLFFIIMYRCRDLVDKMGIEKFFAILKERIPLFPVEVHELRMQA